MLAKNYTSIDDLVKDHKKASHTGSHSKEREPFARSVEQAQIHEVVEHKVTDEEVKPLIKEREEAIELPQELSDIGATTSNYTQFSTYNVVKLPISDEKVLIGLKQSPRSSFRWLAEFSAFILRQAHLSLKNVHGKVVRVFIK